MDSSEGHALQVGGGATEGGGEAPAQPQGCREAGNELSVAKASSRGRYVAHSATARAGGAARSAAPPGACRRRSRLQAQRRSERAQARARCAGGKAPRRRPAGAAPVTGARSAERGKAKRSAEVAGAAHVGAATAAKTESAQRAQRAKVQLEPASRQAGAVERLRRVVARFPAPCDCGTGSQVAQLAGGKGECVARKKRTGLRPFRISPSRNRVRAGSALCRKSERQTEDRRHHSRTHNW